MSHSNPEKKRQYNREWYAQKKLNPEWLARERERCRLKSRRQRAEAPEESRLYHAKKQRHYVRQRRLELVAKLGSECDGCGITDERILTIDHRFGDGGAHRRRHNKGLRVGGGNADVIVRDILLEGAPRDRYRLLCWNCHRLATLGVEVGRVVIDGEVPCDRHRAVL